MPMDTLGHGSEADVRVPLALQSPHAGVTRQTTCCLKRAGRAASDVLASQPSILSGTYARLCSHRILFYTPRYPALPSVSLDGFADTRTRVSHAYHIPAGSSNHRVQTRAHSVPCPITPCAVRRPVYCCRSHRILAKTYGWAFRFAYAPIYHRLFTTPPPAHARTAGFHRTDVWSQNNTTY